MQEESGSIEAQDTTETEQTVQENTVFEQDVQEQEKQEETKSEETQSPAADEEKAENPENKEESNAGEESTGNPDLEEDRSDEEEDERLEARRENLNLDSETALLETVLFLESEPQPVENLAKITQFSEDVVNECIERLKEKYSNADSGIELSQIIGGWILTPKKDSFDLVKERYGKKNEGRLSKAAIETLSIIAYSQPITRAEIESIRHVNADNMMRVLLDRKFIKEVGKKDIPGKPVLYGTTKEFLEFFHLQSIADLPQLDEKESERFDLAR